MKRNIKKRKSNTALDLSLHKNYKVRKLEGNEASQTTTGEPAQSDQYAYSSNITTGIGSKRALLNEYFMPVNEEGKRTVTPIGQVLKTQLEPLGGNNYDTYFGKRDKSTIPNTSKEIDFLLDWYNNPETLKILKQKDQQYNTGVFQNSVNYTDNNGNPTTYNASPEEIVALRSVLATSAPQVIQNGDNKISDKALGEYMRGNQSKTSFGLDINNPIWKNPYGRIVGPQIGYKENPSSPVVIHETNHALQEQVAPYLYVLGNNKEYDYRDHEQHSRLMEARAALGLDPSKRDYTAEEAEQMMNVIKEAEPGGGGSGVTSLFKSINNDAGTFAHMLNTWPLAEDPEEVKNQLFTYRDGGSFNVNKYGGGGAMAEQSAAIAKEAFSGKNLGSSIGGIAGAATGILKSALANAEVDTSSATNAIEATKNHKLDNSSLDALASSYNTTPWADTDLNFKDFRPGAGQLAMNTVKATVQGVTAGASVGGPWGAIAGAAVGLGSSLGGIFAGRAKAKKEEARLEAEAKLANAQKEAQAVANRDIILQQQANSTLRNVAAEGGQLDNYKEGEEYDLSAEEIKSLKSKGYDIDLNYSINEEVDIDPSDIQTLRELGYEFDII